MRAWLVSTFISLEVRNFRILWFGTIFSFVAFFMSMIVQSVVAFEISGSNTAVGSVVAGQGGAMFLFGPIGGVYADRWPRRRVVMVCQLATALVLTLLGGLLSCDRLQLNVLIIAAFVMGASFAFMGPARQSLAVALVPEQRRGNAMAVSQIANTAARVMGPVVAGVLLGWPLAGAEGAYFAMAFLYAASALSMLLIPKSVVRPEAGERSAWSSAMEGFTYVWGHRRLRLLVLFFAIAILIGFPHVTVLPGLLENVYGEDSRGVSALFASSAVGALAASLFVARLADSAQAEVIYTAMAVCFGLGLIAIAVAPGLHYSIVAMFFVGAGSGGFQGLNGAVIARETDPDYMGRVLSLTMLAFAGFGLMALPIGALADGIGEQSTLAIMGGAVLLTSFIFGGALIRGSR